MSSKKRPVHRRIALHPLSVFAVLIVGVLLVAASWRAAAAELLTVQGVVPADPISQPAVIDTPLSESRTDQPSLTVAGTCPADSYVRINRNGSDAGMSTCASGRFSVLVGLAPGSNTLRAQAYNLTNQAGPVSTAITVYYDKPADPVVDEPDITPPNEPSVPVTSQRIVVTGLDRTVPYIDEETDPLTSNRPVFSGLAPPGTRISIEVHSKIVYCNTVANTAGYWRCQLAEALDPGAHIAKFSAQLPDGSFWTLDDVEFHVNAKQAPTTSPPASKPLLLGCVCDYRAQFSGKSVGVPISIAGGTAPYSFVIDWGDGTIETLTNQPANPALTHTYADFMEASRTFQVTITAYDADGQKTVLQSSVVVRNPAVQAGGLLQPSQPDPGMPWFVWFWPAYLIVLLMVVSFWLGEREELRHLAVARQHHAKRYRHPHTRHR